MMYSVAWYQLVVAMVGREETRERRWLEGSIVLVCLAVMEWAMGKDVEVYG